MYKIQAAHMKQMLEHLLYPSEGGFTYDLDNEKFLTPTSGFAVGGSPYPTGILGGWLEGEYVYLDDVDILGSREGAIRLANARDEKAIYDFASKESVYVKVAA